MKKNCELLTEFLLSLFIVILLPINGIFFWLFIAENKNELEWTIYGLLFVLLMILLLVVLYLYFIRCISSTELVILKLINKSIEVVNVIENIKKENLSIKVEVIWYKEIPTDVEEYNSSLERFETVTRNIEHILHKEIIEEVYDTQDNTELFNINTEKQFTLVFIEEEFRFNKNAIKQVKQKIESIDRLYNNKSSRREVKYNIKLTTDYDRILLNKNISKIDWWNEYGRILYWIFSILLLNVPYRIWLNKYFNCQKLVIKKVGREILV